nr:MAG TPA: hypothetical protein [Caudoviricetes sp.]
MRLRESPCYPLHYRGTCGSGLGAILLRGSASAPQPFVVSALDVTSLLLLIV